MISNRALLAGGRALQGKGRVCTFQVASQRAVPRYFSIASSPIARSHLARGLPLRQSGLPPSSIRFATTSATSTAAASSPLASLPASPPTDTLSTSTGQWESGFDGVAYQSGVLPDHLGFMKELGLDFGWGPTAFIQTLLEHVHVYSGLPWWGSIVVTACLVRFAMLKVFVNASDMAARVAVVTPALAPLMARLTEAKEQRDTPALMAATSEVSKVYRAAGVQKWRMALPLLQVPLGYGTFRLLRRMGALPVPGLDEGGFLWFKDLTVPDPFFIFPLITAFFIYRALLEGARSGLEGASGTTVIPPTVRKAITYALPVITAAVMLSWPGCLQLSFALTSTLAWSQAAILRHPLIRRLLQIQPLPPPRQPADDSEGGARYSGTLTRPTLPAPPPAEKPSGMGTVIADVKDKARGVLKKAQDIAAQPEKGGRLTAAELRSAQAYEAKRKRELELQRLREEGDRQGARKRHKRRE